MLVLEEGKAPQVKTWKSAPRTYYGITADMVHEEAVRNGIAREDGLVVAAPKRRKKENKKSRMIKSQNQSESDQNNNEDRHQKQEPEAEASASDDSNAGSEL